MPDRFCPSCGTEVDEDARFCPTCGRTLEIDLAEPAAPSPEPPGTGQEELGLSGDEPGELAEGEAETAAIPAAPAWPPPEPMPEPGEEAEAQPEPGGDAEPMSEPPEPADPGPPDPDLSEPGIEPPPSPPPPQPGATSPEAAGRREPDLPFTMPTTLSGWLIGAGSFLAALSLLPRLGHLLDLLLFLALLAVSATVFLADRVPRIDRQRMIILVVLMIGLGVGLERAGFAWSGTHTIFLVAMLFAAGGALLIEFDRDRPVSPPGGLG